MVQQSSGEIRWDTTAGQEELKRRGVKPVPKPDALTQPYWDAARKHELMIQYCPACNDYQHPPQEQCEQCQGKPEWKKISGKGTIYSFIIDHRNMVPGFTEPYVVAQIVPTEAKRQTVRLTANIKDCDIHDVYIGMPVEVLFEDVNPTVTLPQFKPTSAAKLASRGETPPARAGIS